MNENPFNLFDKILEYLNSNSHRQVTFQELSENIFTQPKKELDFNKLVQKIFEENDKPKLLTNAVRHLESEGLINCRYTKPLEDSDISITQKGILKIKTSGFAKEHNRTVWDRRIDRWNKIVTPIIALLAFGLSLFNYFFPSK